jgi:hypothetical protein
MENDEEVIFSDLNSIRRNIKINMEIKIRKEHIIMLILNMIFLCKDFVEGVVHVKKI